MIVTRFGTPVTILAYNKTTQEVTVRRGSDTMVYMIDELKADGGIAEIFAALDALCRHEDFTENQDGDTICRDCGIRTEAL